MTRLVLAMVAAMVLSGCQHSGQQVVDPFWGRQTVPPPATGSICTPAINPGCQQPVQQPLITQGTPVPSGGLQTTTPPNLLPAPTTPALAPHMPNTPANVTPIPATPAPAGSGVPYGNAGPAMTAPPSSGFSMPNRAPSSGYSNPDTSSSGTTGIPPATPPSTAPAGPYPTWPSSSTTPGGTSPSTSGSAPAATAPSSSAPTTPTPAGPPPTSSPPAGLGPGYVPQGGFSFPDKSGSTSPGPRGTWITPVSVAATPVGLDGATISAPPGTAAADGLDSSPSIVRIPTAIGGDPGTAQASAAMPISPAP